MKTYAELRKINVNEHTEKKGNLTYLSCAWAVDKLLENDPTATWTFGTPMGYADTVMVCCKVTFGDKGRDAPLADFREARSGGGRIVSVGYLALAPGASDLAEHFDAGARWTGLSRFFPWEDWREGRPAVIDEMIAPALLKWAKGETQSDADVRQARIRLLFALDGARWNEERVLERYELLY